MNKTIVMVVVAVGAVLLIEHFAERMGLLGMQPENKNVGVSPYGGGNGMTAFDAASVGNW